VAKEDLEAFMKAKNILPMSQHGFRKGRLCTTALATAHVAWVLAKAKVVAVIGFDLSSAFDTVGREDLLKNMSAMGIGGKALKMVQVLPHECKAARSVGQPGVRCRGRGVRCQAGALLGSVLYLLHPFALPLAREIR
jgi:hypothetical protein